MEGLLIRVGADQSKDGGCFNAPVNSYTGEFAYVPIPEQERIRRNMEKSYTIINPALSRFNIPLPQNLEQSYMHLDPDFEHLTYGDEKGKAKRIQNVLKKGDFIVFYSGMRDMNPDKKQLIYAIIGFYMIEDIIPATQISDSHLDENAHTRRIDPSDDEIVLRAKHGQSGRLERCIPIGDYRCDVNRPNGCPQYRVNSKILREWDGLSTNDGWIQRSASLPKFKNAERFLIWFKKRQPKLVPKNN